MDFSCHGPKNFPCGKKRCVKRSMPESVTYLGESQEKFLSYPIDLPLCDEMAYIIAVDCSSSGNPALL